MTTTPRTAGAEFVTAGAIEEGLWSRMVSAAEYSSASIEDRIALDCLGTYLLAHGPRGPQAGWASHWVGRGEA